LDSWLGDIRLALCLRDTGILLQGKNLFTKYPPNNNFYYEDPCIRQIAFHHLLPHQSQRLYEAELKNGMNGITLSHIAPYFLKNGMEWNTSRAGGDYNSLSMNSADECYKKCQSESKCVSFEFNNGVCYVKQHIPDATESKNVISGVVLSHYKCNK
jgi:hypothetical protein